MPRMRILEALLNAKVPVYLCNIIPDDFRNWVVFTQTASGMVKKEITCGVLQGSVLRPLLWNIAFDDILKEKVPPEVSIICYTDDTLVVVTEDDTPMLQRKVNTIPEAMTHWIESARLSLATTKTEAVLFTHHHQFGTPSFCLKWEHIRLCTSLKYLGLWFDRKLTFKSMPSGQQQKLRRSMRREPRGGRARVSVSCWWKLQCRWSYMEPQCGLTHQCQGVPKNRGGFGPI